jgi:hypothetical protein
MGPDPEPACPKANRATVPYNLANDKEAAMVVKGLEGNPRFSMNRTLVRIPLRQLPQDISTDATSTGCAHARRGRLGMEIHPGGRLALHIEESLYRGTQGVAFETMARLFR